LRIGSVDRFQGIECPVIICSFVRNNPKGEIGFAKDPRRVNVALSRAQELSIIVGCSELFCSTNKNSSATRIYQTIAKIILDVGGIRNALDFR
jgi:superfamily I DNA and/or RNA helicase